MRAGGSSRPDSLKPIFISTNPVFSIAATRRVDLEEAIGEAARAKTSFTPEDVHARATRTLEKAILQGTTHMRTHLEVDPGVGLRSLEGVLPSSGTMPGQSIFRFAFSPRRASSTTQVRTN